MTFDEILDHVIDMLQRRGRVSYRAPKRQFDLDDAYLADLKAEIIEVHRLAVEQDGAMLVWTGAAQATPTLTTTSPQAVQPQAPLGEHTAQDLPPTEPQAPDAERRQLIVMFVT